MPQTINTNVASLNAQRNLNSSQSDANTALQRLSSGLRINSAKDDAAGLAISNRLTSQINGINQAIRNAVMAFLLLKLPRARSPRQETFCSACVSFRCSLLTPLTVPATDRHFKLRFHSSLRKLIELLQYRIRIYQAVKRHVQQPTVSGWCERWRDNWCLNSKLKSQQSW